MKIPTTEQVTTEFMTDFRALLEKHGAEIIAICRRDGIKMIVDIPTVLDAKNNCLRRSAQIELGNRVNFYELTAE